MTPPAVPPAVAPRTPLGSAPRSAPVVFDLRAALVFLDGSQELLQEVFSEVRASTPASLASVRDALARGSAADVAKAAHRLKGSFAVSAALEAAAAASALEQAARAGDVTPLPALADALDAAYARLLEEWDRLSR